MSINEKRETIIEFFKELEFNEKEHKYNHKERQLCSVSSAIKNYVEPFDADKVAGFVARSRGISKEKVLAEWEEKKNAACSKGHRVHYFGENYTEDSIPTDGYEKAIVKFWNDLPDYIVPVIFELKMYSTELGIAGTADIILYNLNTEKFIIADYKTNIDLFKNYKGKKLLKPFGKFLDNPFNKYQIQLTYYQKLFELTGYEVEDRVLIWLKPDGTYKKYHTKNLVNYIK